MDSNLSQEGLNGDVALRERDAAPTEYDTWSSTDLVSRGWNKMDFYVEPIDEDGRRYLKIELSCYHVENPDTGHFFHADLMAHLTRQQAVELKGYLEFLLTCGALG